MENIMIGNNGQSLEYTNYWDSEYALSGIFYLTWNAGAARLLVPDNQLAMISEMATGKDVIVSSGPWHAQGGRGALEILFEDGSNAPFALTLVDEQSDRRLPPEEHGRTFKFDVWTSQGRVMTLRGKYRTVDSIPCLAPWEVRKKKR